MNSNSTHFNLLASFAYLGKNKDFTDEFFNLHETGRANVMVDSGAYTKHNSKENRDWLTLDSYCDFIEKHEDACEKYVQLDIIGNQEGTRKNYEQMVARGLAPMFVLTMFDNDWEYFAGTMDVNRDCCVAGGVSTKGPWLIKRFQDANKHTDGKVKIHALGYVTFPNIIRAPIVSGDSSSWIQQPQVYGILNAWTPQGLKQQEYKKVWAGKEKLKPQIITALERLEITPAQFMSKECQRGSLTICTLMSMVAYIEYQKFVWEKSGKRLFLAVGSKVNLDMLEWVNENLSTVTYNGFVEEFRNIK